MSRLRADMSIPELRDSVAAACRILAHRGLTDGILGHVSARVDERTILVRCRGPHERGLAKTTAADIQLVDLDGNLLEFGEADAGYTVPNELPLHTEVFRLRPEIAAVVHAHPPGVVTADLARLPLRPLIGAFDIPGMRLAAQGIPVYPRGVLIRNRELAKEMIIAMGEAPVVILRGHGLTSIATSGVETAVLQAIRVETLSRLSLNVVAAGGTLVALPKEDIAELPDLGDSFNIDVAWRHELARLGEAVETTGTSHTFSHRPLPTNV